MTNDATGVLNSAEPPSDIPDIPTNHTNMSSSELRALTVHTLAEVKASSAKYRAETKSRNFRLAQRLVARDAHNYHSLIRQQPDAAAKLFHSLKSIPRTSSSISMPLIERPPPGTQWARATTNFRPPEGCDLSFYVPYLGESDEKQERSANVAQTINDCNEDENDSDVEGLEPMGDGDEVETSQRRRSINSGVLRVSKFRWDRENKMLTIERMIRSNDPSKNPLLVKTLCDVLRISESAHLWEYIRLIEMQSSGVKCSKKNHLQRRDLLDLVRGHKKVPAAAAVEGDSIPFLLCRRCYTYDCSLHGNQKSHPKHVIPDKTRLDTASRALKESIANSCKHRLTGDCWHVAVDKLHLSRQARTSSESCEDEDDDEPNENLSTRNASNCNGVPPALEEAETGEINPTSSSGDGLANGTTIPRSRRGAVGRPPANNRQVTQNRQASNPGRPPTAHRTSISYTASEVPKALAKEGEQWWSQLMVDAKSFGGDLKALLQELLPIFGPDFCRLSHLLGTLMSAPSVGTSADTLISCKRVGYICYSYFPKLLVQPTNSCIRSVRTKLARPTQELGVMNGNGEMRPHYVPCRHKGACSLENCSCVQAGVFCEKYCGCNHKRPTQSRFHSPPTCDNAFRGCTCKSTAACCSKACPCFSWRRECDPDLCRTCHKCIDKKDGKSIKCQNEGLRLGLGRRVVIGRSTVHGWGVFAVADIPRNAIIGEYIGEVLDYHEAEKRGQLYDANLSSFIFDLTPEESLDSTRFGNKLRCCNHDPVNPNCEPRVMRVEGDVRIGIYAKRDIRKHEELFFNYGSKFNQEGIALKDETETPKDIQMKAQRPNKPKKNVRLKNTPNETGEESDSTQEPRPVAVKIREDSMGASSEELPPATPNPTSSQSIVEHDHLDAPPKAQVDEDFPEQADRPDSGQAANANDFSCQQDKDDSSRLKSNGLVTGGGEQPGNGVGDDEKKTSTGSANRPSSLSGPHRNAAIHPKKSADAADVNRDGSKQTKQADGAHSSERRWSQAQPSKIRRKSPSSSNADASSTKRAKAESFSQPRHQGNHMNHEHPMNASRKIGRVAQLALRRSGGNRFNGKRSSVSLKGESSSLSLKGESSSSRYVGLAIDHIAFAKNEDGKIERKATPLDEAVQTPEHPYKNAGARKSGNHHPEKQTSRRRSGIAPHRKEDRYLVNELASSSGSDDVECRDVSNEKEGSGESSKKRFLTPENMPKLKKPRSSSAEARAFAPEDSAEQPNKLRITGGRGLHDEEVHLVGIRKANVKRLGTTSPIPISGGRSEVAGDDVERVTWALNREDSFDAKVLKRTSEPLPNGQHSQKRTEGGQPSQPHVGNGAGSGHVLGAIARRTAAFRGTRSKSMRGRPDAGNVRNDGGHGAHDSANGGDSRHGHLPIARPDSRVSQAAVSSERERVQENGGSARLQGRIFTHRDSGLNGPDAQPSDVATMTVVDLTADDDKY